MAGARGFSSARTSLKFLLGIVLLTLPVTLLILGRTVLRATPLPTPSVIVVTTFDDPAQTSGNGFCTLREAINNANNTGVDTTEGDCDVAETTNVMILFLFSGDTIFIGSSLPQISTNGLNLTIMGNGKDHLVEIHGGLAYRVFDIASGATLSLANGLAVSGGKSTDGGGAYNAGTLNVDNCLFDSNIASNSASGQGGAIFNSGILNLTGGTSFISNTADASGGAVASTSSATTTIKDVQFSVNSAPIGGAIYDVGSLTVSLGGFFANLASAQGAAAFIGNGVTLDTSWFVNNQQSALTGADDGGAGIYVAGGTANISDTMFGSGNSATGSGGGDLCRQCSVERRDDSQPGQLNFLHQQFIGLAAARLQPRAALSSTLPTRRFPATRPVARRSAKSTTCRVGCSR